MLSKYNLIKIYLYIGIVTFFTSVCSSEVMENIWDNEASFGLSYRSGSTEKSLYTLNLSSEFYSNENDWIHSLYSEHGETEGSQTEGLVRLKSEYRKRFNNPKFFGSVFLQGVHDVIRGIDLRGQFGPNIGFYAIDNKSMKLDTLVGLNATHEIGKIEESTYTAYRVAAKFDWHLNEYILTYASIEINGSVKDPSEDYNGLLIFGIKSYLLKEISMHTELRNDYDNQPESITAEKNDLLLTVGLGYKF